MQIFRPFSPSIGKFKIPNDVINDINIHVNETIKDSNLTKKLDHGKNLAGEVTQEFKLTKEFLKKGLLNIFANATKDYIFNSDEFNTNKKEITKFELIESWVVRHFEYEYNPTHWHGGHISGVAYLQLPDSFGPSKKNDNRNGYIEFIHGTRQFLNNSTISFKPKIGDLYIFPHYLMHTVFPFFGKGERRSVSFNAYIDQNIFNVHGKN